MRLRLVLPRGRGRAGLGRLSRTLWPAAFALLACLVIAGCGGSSAEKATSRGAPVTTPTIPQQAPPARGPAFGVTEDNADILWPPTSAAPSGGAAFQAARERLAALHPRYVRLLVDWAALQPQPDAPANLEGAVDGCARSVSPCGAYAGIREDLRALAAQQRAASAEGRPGYEVVLDVFGTPAWAARPPGGCELASTTPFARPINAAGVAGYRSLIRSLLALGAREGVALTWWAPWNEPNDPIFLSPQRASCDVGAAPLAPGVYAQLAQAMADELAADGGVHHLLLGELAGYGSNSPHHMNVASFVAALPESVVCLSTTWSIHSYAANGRSSNAQPERESAVNALERPLDARGACGRRASIWVTEVGAALSRATTSRVAHTRALRGGCLALAAQLARWTADPRVAAVLQYTFREDPAYPVGLLSADLSHVYPTYGLWLRYARASAREAPLPSAAALCA